MTSACRNSLISMGCMAGSIAGRSERATVSARCVPYTVAAADELVIALPARRIPCSASCCFSVIAIPVVIILARQVRRALYVRDAEGRRVRSGLTGLVAMVVGSLLVLLLVLLTLDPGRPGRSRAGDLQHDHEGLQALAAGRDVRVAGDQPDGAVRPQAAGVHDVQHAGGRPQGERGRFARGRPRRKGCRSAST